MSDALTFNGHRYASERALQAAKAEHQDAQQRRQAAEARRAAEHEEALRRSFLTTPGATEEDWTREKAGILAKDRETRALSREDVARQASALRYQG